MRKRKIIFCTLAMMAAISLFCFGCSWTTQETSKGTVIRCPKCGDFYQSKEGTETLEHMHRGETRK
jgi:predicted RNA-binding Zn-ribbon protein involved in translation (DUF1610 family)